MQVIGHLLAASLLVFSIFSVFADKAEEHPAPVSKRSANGWTEGTKEDGSHGVAKRFAEFVGKRSGLEVDPLADKRYEFVGKRGPYEFIGKRPYEFLGKRSPYEFVGKRGPYEFVGKRSPYEFVGKRGPYEFVGKRGPYEFVGKRGPYEFVGKRGPYEFVGKRPSAFRFGLPVEDKRGMVDFYGKRVELPYEFVGKRIFGTTAFERLTTEEISDVLRRQTEGEEVETQTQPGATVEAASQEKGANQRGKRYSEWLGKRNPASNSLSDELLRNLAQKRISAMLRNHAHSSSAPEFIGRREEDEEDEEEEVEEEKQKRYAEFLG